jgi:exonuclease VII large subunit
MEDDFELISKQHLKDLRDENKRLKAELANAPKQVDNSKLISDILEAIHEESKKERELIIHNLNDIKDLNKTTLDNLLINTQNLENKFEKVIETMSSLVSSLSEMLENNFEGEKEEIRELINKLMNFEPKNNLDIMIKLDEIDSFMKNLRVLLSYVKPSDYVVDKPKI